MDAAAALVTDAKVNAEPRDAWRLGHRRPWWQWNVLTLFGSLFVLIWVRELFWLSQTFTWMACIVLLMAWTLGPMGVITSREMGADSARRAMYGAASAAILTLIAFSAGPATGAFSALAAVMLAAAVRTRRDEVPLASSDGIGLAPSSWRTES